MKRIHYIALIVLLVLLALGVYFISKSKGDTRGETETTEYVNPIVYESWYSKKVSIDSKLYTLPFNFSLVEDLENIEYSEIPELVSTICEIEGYLVSSDGSKLKIVFGVRNPRYGNDTSISDCEVYKINIINEDDSDVNFMLPGGIKFGSSFEDVVKKYGNPVAVTVLDNGKSDALYKVEKKSIVIVIGYRDNRVSSILIEV